MVGAGVLYDFLGGRGGGVGPHSQGGRELEGVGVVERGGPRAPMLVLARLPSFKSLRMAFLGGRGELVDVG